MADGESKAMTQEPMDFVATIDARRRMREKREKDLAAYNSLSFRVLVSVVM